MAYSSLKYIYESKIEEIKKVIKVYDNEKIQRYKDINVSETFWQYDYLIEINDIDTIIKNSVLEREIEKIETLKIKFEQSNTSILREKGTKENDELIETTDREIMNRSLVNNLRRRGLNFTTKDAIYYKNGEDESYNEIKAYYINTTLSKDYNRDFDAIALGLKNTIASKKQSFTIFKTLFAFRDKKRSYVVVIPEMTFNNEKFTKSLYKLFAPYFTLVMVEIAQISIEQSNTWKESVYKLIIPESEKVVSLQKGIYQQSQY